jgi:hypothetical protein
MPSWDRQHGESEIAYEAFKTFLALEGKRSIRNASKVLSKTHGTLNRWAKQNHWYDRARDYDNNREKIILSTELAEEKKRLRKVISKRHEFGAYIESFAIKTLSRLNERLDDDPDFLVYPKDMLAILLAGLELQEAEYPEYANEQTARKGIQALAESIGVLADKTIARHESRKIRDD